MRVRDGSAPQEMRRTWRRTTARTALCNGFVAVALGAAALAFGASGCRTPGVRHPGGGPAEPRAVGLKQAKGSGLEILSRQVTLRFDERGAASRKLVIRYRLNTRRAVSKYDGVGSSWAPWFEERPQISATVKTPDGKTHELDPSTIAVQPMQSRQSQVLTDHRRLYAKLPALVPGSEVTLRIRTQEKRPMVAAGGVHHLLFASWLPTRHVKVVIEAPEERPLHVTVRGVKVTRSTDRTRGGVRRIVYEAGPFIQDDLWEPLLPYDVPRTPYVAVSSAKSWRAVANAYLRRIRDQIRTRGAGRYVDAAKRVAAGHGRLALISALLSRLRKELRYTSLAFGEKAIVPVRPAVALRRGYGDCKDMSTVLVSWLRAAGIQAYLALVRAGTGEDVLPAEPGLNRFNHAIVYVPAGGGAPALWIDPTARFTKPQSPPWQIQDRWALVIRPETTGLTKIPASRPQDNRYQETREVHFQPDGGARIVETSENTGYHEASLRRVVGNFDTKQFKKNMEDYAKRVYLSEKLKATKHGDPRDLTHTFRLRLEMDHARRAWTNDQEAKFKLSTWALWRFGGRYLMQPPAPDAKKFKRKRPLYLPRPYHTILIYRLTAPPGYKVKSRPQSGRRQLGPASMSWWATEAKHGTEVVVRYRFSVGKRRWSPKELQTFWTALRSVYQQVPEGEVIFEHRATTLEREGKVRAALDVIRELHRKYPDQPVYYRQLANELQDLGYGVKARALLREGLAKFPKNANLWFVYGVHLERDLYGNEHAPGWDYAGALAAYRKAVALDKKSAIYAANLARLLTLDKDANWLRGAKALAPAIQEYERLRRELKHTGEDPAFAWTLLRARQIQKLRALLPTLKLPKLRPIIDLGLWVAQHGEKGALQRARQLAGDDQKVPTLLAASTLVLFELGRFRTAGALLLSMARLGGVRGADLEPLRRLRSRADLERSAKTPKRVVLRLFRRAVANQMDPQVLRAELYARSMSAETQKELTSYLRRLGRILRDAHNFNGQISAMAAADFTLSEVQAKSQGNDRVGHLVLLKGQDERHPLLTAFVVKEAGGYRVRACRAVPQAVGTEVLARLRRGDLQGARQWLDWFRGRHDAAVSPYFGSPFSHTWEAGVKGHRSRVRLAAAMLALQSKVQRARARRILEAALARGPDREVRIQILRRLALVYRNAGQWAKAARTTAKLWRMSHRSRYLLFDHVIALLHAKKLAAARQVATRYRKRHPSRWQGTYALAVVATWSKQFAQAGKLLDELIARGEPPKFIYNNRAWLGLFLTPFNGPRTLKHAKTAVNLTQHKDASSLDTLAVIEAEMGHLKESRQAFRQCLQAMGWTTPKKHSWFAYGLIAEKLGLHDVARASYLKVPKPKGLMDPTDPWHLAQRHLNALGKAPARTHERRRR